MQDFLPTGLNINEYSNQDLKNVFVNQNEGVFITGTSGFGKAKPKLYLRGDFTNPTKPEFSTKETLENGDVTVDIILTVYITQDPSRLTDPIFKYLGQRIIDNVKLRDTLFGFIPN